MSSRLRIRLILSLAFSLACHSILHGEAVSLFDGKTLRGWEGETSKVWRVEDGTITGGTLAGNPQNEFLATTKTYRNFRLKLEYKLHGTEGFVNGGVQFRSKRIPQPPNEMSGYQADIGAGYTGCLYDESRRKKMLATADKEAVIKLEKKEDWNQYEIQAIGTRVTIKLNGVVTVDYSEREPGIEDSGVIALQIHGDCKAVIAFRHLTLETLPDDATASAEVLNRFGGDLPAAARPQPWPQGGFTLAPQETVIFTGQTNTILQQKAGLLEALLATAHAPQQPRFRYMAWEADTVYEQWRELNFGSWPAQLQAAGATVIAAQYGQMEALDGLKRLPEFSSAYHSLLDQWATVTPRLILISPMPFEKPKQAKAPDLTARNAEVKAYAEAVRKIAQQRHAVYVDLFTPLSERAADAPRLTHNGIHLHEEGLKVVAALVAEQLGAKAASSAPDAQLLAAIVQKNQLWFDCWRPANWSFVYGDRVTQNFGKGAGDEPSLREAFERHKPMIADQDSRIHDLALGIPLPPVQQSPITAPPTEKVMTPEEQKATFTLKEGYEVNLFASEIEGVAKPTQFTWDEQGRLYVACSPTYPHTLPGVKPSDYILVLQDTDGDGRADKSWRYAEGLTMVQGLEPGGGGLYVCDFDQLLLLRDTDGDGKADTREVIASGFGIGDTHQLVNSISYGPDGDLWFTQGLHAFSRVESPWGISRLHKAGVWKYNPRTMKLDAYFNGGKAGHNCWGVAFDDYFQVFHKSGDRPDGYYTVPGMITREAPDEYHPIGSLFKSSPKTTALEIIGTKALPQELQGGALIGGYFGSVVEVHRLSDEASGFRSEQLPRLLTASSDAFRPVDVSVGPDGAIYLADWFNPVIGHYQASYADPRRDRTHGRIWRITAKGYPSVKAPALASMSPTELLDQLRSPERWTRTQARRLLFNLPADQVLPAADAWVEKQDVSAPEAGRTLLEVIGVYQSHDAPRPALLAKVLASSDARVRAYGARVIGSWAASLPNALELLAKCANDPHPRVRLEAVVAGSHLPKLETVDVITQVLSHPTDKFIDYALKQSVMKLQPEWQPALAKSSDLFHGDAKRLGYLRDLAGSAEAPPHPGKAIYDALCLNCHQPDGKGLPGVYPSIAESDWVSGDPTRLIKILLHGLSGPITVSAKPFVSTAPLPMPPMGLNDEQTADVLTYIRSQFGNQASAITAETVKAVRAAHKERTTFWTEQELRP